MGDVVNLRQARKAKRRQAEAQAADEARVRHGRTKGQKLAEFQTAERYSRTLAGSRLEGTIDAEGVER